jgi:aspartate 1-decarboxylase
MAFERELLKSKIHRATVTEADVHYLGSISIDEDLMERVDLWPGEKVSVWSVNTRERIDTYAIPAPRGSGQIKLNGGAANRFDPGDVVVIYCTGLGEVNPPVPSGSPAPSSPLAKTITQPSVTIGGAQAAVQFAGLTPGLVSVYQVNAVVPAVSAGDQVTAVITAGGQQSNPVTMAVR